MKENVELLIHYQKLISVDSDCSHKTESHLFLGRKALTNLDSILKSRDITLLTKVHLVKAMVFSNSHLWMWELDYKESWTLKNWCFETGVGEDSQESLWQQGDQTSPSYWKSILNIHWKDWCWSSNTLATWCKSWCTGKDPESGKDWRQKEKGVTEDEMVR